MGNRIVIGNFHDGKQVTTRWVTEPVASRVKYFHQISKSTCQCLRIVFDVRAVIWQGLRCERVVIAIKNTAHTVDTLNEFNGLIPACVRPWCRGLTVEHLLLN